MRRSMFETAAREDWLSPTRQPRPAEVAERAQPLVLVAEAEPVLTPMVAELCGFLRVRALVVAPERLEEAMRAQGPVGVLCHAERTNPRLATALRAVVAADPGMPVMVVTEHDASREARLAAAAEIIRLDRLVWLERLPDLRAWWSSCS